MFSWLTLTFRKHLLLQEWPDATDTGEESDSSVGRPDDMPAANHEVPHINVEVPDIMLNPYILIRCTHWVLLKVSSDSDDNTLEEDEVPGRPGAPYRGYGRCFKCGEIKSKRYHMKSCQLFIPRPPWPLGCWVPFLTTLLSRQPFCSTPTQQMDRCNSSLWCIISSTI